MGMGNEHGWVEDSVLVRKHTTKDGVVTEDYHSNITAELFEGWLKKLLSKLPQGSVLVFDNASYHSKKDENNAPRSNWNKDRLKRWLKAKNVDFHPKALLKDLYDLARE